MRGPEGAQPRSSACLPGPPPRGDGQASAVWPPAHGTCLHVLGPRQLPSSAARRLPGAGPGSGSGTWSWPRGLCDGRAGRPRPGPGRGSAAAPLLPAAAPGPADRRAGAVHAQACPSQATVRQEVHSAPSVPRATCPAPCIEVTCRREGCSPRPACPAAAPSGPSAEADTRPCSPPSLGRGSRGGGACSPAGAERAAAPVAGGGPSPGSGAA